jgi:hypothetical protein
LARKRDTRKHTQPAFAVGIEVATLRAPWPGENDFDPELELSTWCRLHETLPPETHLRFLVRELHSQYVVVGGVYVRDLVIIASDDGFSVDRDLEAENDILNALEQRPGHNHEGKWLIRVNQLEGSNRQDCFLCFQMTPGEYFAYYFRHQGEEWRGIVELTEIEMREAEGDEPECRVAKFDIRFEQKANMNKKAKTWRKGPQP